MIEPVDLRQTWDTAKDMLDAVADNQDWRSEDIYAACISGAASLYMPDDDDEGLVVLRLLENQFTGDKYLFVWVAYSPLGDAQGKYGDEITTIAKDAGCDYIEFESKRKEFEKRGGWIPQNTTYRKKVR